MNQYRDFENDQVRFGYGEAAEFLDRLHANEQHYVPIVDSAIYAPNPANASDAYPTYDRGVKADAFILNPDGSLYVGSVWPGYTGRALFSSFYLLFAICYIYIKNCLLFFLFYPQSPEYC